MVMKPEPIFAGGSSKSAISNQDQNFLMFAGRAPPLIKSWRLNFKERISPSFCVTTKRRSSRIEHLSILRFRSVITS